MLLGLCQKRHLVWYVAMAAVRILHSHYAHGKLIHSHTCMADMAHGLIQLLLIYLPVCESFGGQVHCVQCVCVCVCVHICNEFLLSSQVVAMYIIIALKYCDQIYAGIIC